MALGSVQDRMASWSTLWALRSSAETGVLGTFRAIMTCPWGIHCTASRQDTVHVRDRITIVTIVTIPCCTTYCRDFHCHCHHDCFIMVYRCYRASRCALYIYIYIHVCVLESCWYIVAAITISIVDIADIYPLPRWKLGPVILVPGCRWAASAAHRQRQDWVRTESWPGFPNDFRMSQFVSSFFEPRTQLMYLYAYYTWKDGDVGVSFGDVYRFLFKIGLDKSFKQLFRLGDFADRMSQVLCAMSRCAV